MATAQSAGITDATSDQWRRATTQAAPALAFALSASPTWRSPGRPASSGRAATATLKVTGVAEGERVCVAGPGIAGTRSLVAGGSGALTTSVRAPGPDRHADLHADLGDRHQDTVKVSVLGKAKLAVKAKKKKVAKGDTPGRQGRGPRGRREGRRCGCATTSWPPAPPTPPAVFKAKFTIKKKLAAPGRPKVVVTGQFKDLRKGTTYFRVTR